MAPFSTIYALGAAQIISWGTLFYAIGVLGPQMGRALGLPEMAPFGSFTLGLVISGIASPRIGRLIDERGGRLVMSCGSLLSALAMGLLAATWNTTGIVVAWVAGGLAMGASLYDASFATVSQLRGIEYRRAVAVLTIMGALASTAFWPLSLYLSELVGWRLTWAVYAAMHLGFCLPVHWFLLPTHAARSLPAGTRAEEGTGDPPPGAVRWLSGAFALASFVFSVCVVHVIELLQQAGLTPAQAVGIAMLIGPVQVVGRLAEFRFARNFRAVTLGYVPFALGVIALAVLPFVHGTGVLAVTFVLTLGAGNGLLTISRGTVPHELFGARRLGELLGRVSRTSIFARALAPASLSAMVALGMARSTSLGTLFGVSVLALAGYAIAVRRG